MGIHYADKFPIVFKQFMELFTRDRLEILKRLSIQGRILLENVQFEQNIQQQQLQSKNLVAGAEEISMDEVLYVHS
ncbi:two-component sensor histidine kinase [Nostoc cycadae WK-1]|uniref:Two-component sensor histidine kinase n=2 Tax=Nostocales TaxID=1161 RepID=A0A2H6LP74_9NOSO|nr:two-component sensor histidine kinase [Nostoc cycadae WK-1]